MAEVSEDRRRELTERIKKQVAFEEKAFRIVEKLVDVTPSEELLREDLNCITFDQYSDIVDERSITKLCGYPVCGNTLSDVPSKTYHISIKTKTVYDISQRKKYCSNQCYKASDFLQKQIPTSPIWLREKEPVVPINFMPPELNKGSVGEVIVTRRTTELRDDVEVLKKLDALTLPTEPTETKIICSEYRPSSEHIDSSSAEEEVDHGAFSDEPEVYDSQSRMPVLASDNDSTSVLPSNKIPSPKAVETITNTRSIAEYLSQKRKGTFKNCVVDIADDRASGETVENVVKPKQTRKPSQPARRVIEIVVPKRAMAVKTVVAALPENKPTAVTVSHTPSFTKIRSTLLEWKTSDTVSLINPNEAGSRESRDNTVSYDDQRFEGQLQMFDKLLNDRENAVADIAPPTKQLPDLEKLKEDNKKYELKVREFYGEKKQVHFSESDVQSAEFKAKEVVLPFVDLHSQNAIRRKVVLDKLDHVLLEIVERSSLRLSNVSTSIRDLVHTFRLTSKNIILKSGEWVLVGYILLKIIGRQDVTVGEALKSDTVAQYISQLLVNNSVTDSDIDEIVHEMMTMTSHSEAQTVITVESLSGASNDEILD